MINDFYFLVVGLLALVAFLGLVCSSLCRDRERLKEERDMYRDQYYELRNKTYRTGFHKVV